MKQAFHQKKHFILNSRGKGIAEEDYQHAQTVWKEFNIESMKDYQNLYNLFEVLLLAHVFENFRIICMNHCGLDQAGYCCTLGLAWYATLKFTKVQLEFLSDPDMFLMIESGIRGRIATLSHRHAKANNEYMGAEFDSFRFRC